MHNQNTYLCCTTELCSAPVGASAAASWECQPLRLPTLTPSEGSHAGSSPPSRPRPHLQPLPTCSQAWELKSDSSRWDIGRILFENRKTKSKPTVKIRALPRRRRTGAFVAQDGRWRRATGPGPGDNTRCCDMRSLPPRARSARSCTDHAMLVVSSAAAGCSAGSVGSVLSAAGTSMYPASNSHLPPPSFSPIFFSVLSCCFCSAQVLENTYIMKPQEHEK